MSRSIDPSANFDLAAQIDRLVADELSAEDRRTLLLRLETTTAGWRRCALAFLEDQAWRTALAEPHLIAVAPPVVPALPRSSQAEKIRSPLTRSVLAAGLLAVAAFASYRAGISTGSRADRGLTETTPAAVPLGKTSSAVTPEATVPGRPLGWVNLPDPASGGAGFRQVPVLVADEANQRWLQEQPASIPDYVKVQWERRGYQVGESRRLVGLDLNDGRRVAIPVDEVALDYVGQQPL